VRRLSTSLVDAIAAVDAANSADPTFVTVRGETLPLALAHGRLADLWVDRLMPRAPDAVHLAARAHHLRRWEVPRATYPDGRAGYLRWRRDQKARHARDVEAILVEHGYGPDVVGRVQALVRREGLGSDPQAQVIEDAACLAFLETQLAELADRIDPELIGDVLRKTAKKMSPAALGLVPDVPLTDAARGLLSRSLP
jgi:hypothetical protein